MTADAVEHEVHAELSRSNCPQVGQMKGIMMRAFGLAVRRRLAAALPT